MIVDRSQKCGALGGAAVFLPLLLRVFAIGDASFISFLYFLLHFSWSAALCEGVSVNVCKRCSSAGLCKPAYTKAKIYQPPPPPSGPKISDLDPHSHLEVQLKSDIEHTINININQFVFIPYIFRPCRTIFREVIVVYIQK